MLRLFNLCTRFLVFLTKVFQTDYKRVSVWVNIYVQGLILFVAASFAFISLLIKGNYSTSSWLWYIFTIMQIFVVVWASYHYRPPLIKAFDKCYWDLVHLSSRIHLSYTLLNIIIFIIIYLILVFLDIYLIVMI